MVHTFENQVLSTVGAQFKAINDLLHGHTFYFWLFPPIGFKRAVLDRKTTHKIKEVEVNMGHAGWNY